MGVGVMMCSVGVGVAVGVGVGVMMCSVGDGVTIGSPEPLADGDGDGLGDGLGHGSLPITFHE